MLAPMTFIVTLMLIVAVVFGVLVLIRALGSSGAAPDDVAWGTQSTCPHCRRDNPTHARFCAHCGKPLS